MKPSLRSLFVAPLLLLVACRTDDSTTNDAATTTDTAVNDTSAPDTRVGNDATAPDGPNLPDAPRTDGTLPGPEAGMDGAVTGTPVTMAVLTNPTATGHPASRTRVRVSDSLVALSPRLFISQSTTTMRCLYAAWVGTSAGSDFSAIEVYESLPPPAAGMDCFAMSEVGNIPANLAIGDTLGPVAGTYDEYCPSTSTCPRGAAAELDVASTAGGSFMVLGHGGMVPAATNVSIAEVSAMGAMAAPRDLALQNSLVRLQGTVLQTPPSTANHDVMLVSVGAGATPTMAVNVAKYSGVGCQRTALGARMAGASVGDITGILEYSFGQWVLQPRQTSDLPGVVCADAGTADAATPDTGASDAARLDALGGG